MDAIPSGDLLLMEAPQPLPYSPKHSSPTKISHPSCCYGVANAHGHSPSQLEVSPSYSQKFQQKYVTSVNQSKFYIKSDILQTRPKSYQRFGQLCNKICSPKLSKIAQSGRTDLLLLKSSMPM